MLKNIKKEIEAVQSLVKSKVLTDKITSIKTQAELEKIADAAKKLSLSLVMLVKDQEEVISKVLEKLHSLNLGIDEYHVVDTGSTDNTVKILKSLKFVTVHELNWIEDYSFMRNEAAKFVQTDWIIIIDSDEIFLSGQINLKLLIVLLEEVCRESFSINFEQHTSGISSYGVPARMYNPQEAKFFGLVHEELRDKKTGSPVKGVLTRIKVENLGTSPEEIQRFSKDERYFKSLKKMMTIEPDNPRWFSLLPEEGIRSLVENGEFEKLSLKYLFKNGEYSLTEENLNRNTYTRTLIEHYVVFQLAQGDFKKAEEFIEFSLSIYPLDINLMFYQTVMEIERVKNEAKSLLKINLGRYLSLDKQKCYDYNYSDLELLEMTLAELNLLSGNQTMANKILSNLKNQNVVEFWEKWNR